MYQPIYKGKKAEFDSWSHASSARRVQANPLFEIVAAKGISADLEKFRDMLLGSCQQGDVVAVDALALGDDAVEPNSGLGPYSWLARQCAGSGVTIRAVLHLADGSAFVADAISALGPKDIVLRIGGTDGDPQPTSSDTTLTDWCRAARLLPSDVHLLIDLASIYGLDQTVQQALAQAYLIWASTSGPWATVTLASGAFPAQISSLAKSTPNSIPRLDAALWNQARSLSPISDLQFGDYGVRHTELADGGFGGPLPNIRYATDSEWIVWREAKHPQYPNGSFYKACVGIVGHTAYSGSAFSWADGVIDQKSRANPGPQPGAGTGTDWITYGMNRHLEFVVDRLTTHGAA